MSLKYIRKTLALFDISTLVSETKILERNLANKVCKSSIFEKKKFLYKVV